MTTADLQSEVARLRNELHSLAAVGGEDDEQITVSDYLLTRLEQLGVTVCPLFCRSVELI